MSDQPHGRFPRHFDPAQLLPAGHLQARKIQMWQLHLDEKPLPPARGLKRKFHHKFAPGFVEAPGGRQSKYSSASADVMARVEAAASTEAATEATKINPDLEYHLPTNDHEVRDINLES